jgi:predicted transcriptional regulator
MVREMMVEEILKIIIERNKPEGFYFLAVLKLADGPMLKEKLGEEVNKQYQLRKGDVLIKSRHTLNQITDRLFGAGLVNIQEIGRSRLIIISPLGEFILEYNQKIKNLY